eukprot:TRINITY_DN80_c1_g1_i1.p1 TRINITY_DN80_c1_g1~~TRINITY_DN80_c1_g1_i1.p1  ORF type:complete len:345 (-),score=65.62 TRINITY_DN80_c1_g1_i1:58-1008(-)
MLYETFIAVLVIGVFAAGVAALLFYWPFPTKPFLDRSRKLAHIADIREISPDVKLIRLDTGGKGTPLGLPIGKHIKIYAPSPDSCLADGQWNGKNDPDKGAKEICRNYTPTTIEEKSGYVDLLVKIYKPGKTRMPDGTEVEWKDGGKMSLYLDSKKPGDTIEIQGPVGLNEYLGRSLFKLPGRTVEARHVGLLAGGTGINPMLQLILAALKDTGDRTNFYLIYANKTEDDILMRDRLDEAASRSKGRLKVTYTLDFPPKGWKGKEGFITESMIRECLPKPSAKPLILMCGPPPMVEFACKKNLDALGYTKLQYVAL